MSLPSPLAGSRGRRFALLVANGSAQAVLLLAVALLTREAFDAMRQGSGATSADLGPLAIGLAVAVVLGAGLRWRGHFDAEALGQDYVHAVRERLFSHVLALGGQGRRLSEGATALRFLGDLTALRQWLSLGLARLAVAGVSSALALAALAILAPRVAGAVAIVMALTLLGSAAVEPALRRATADSRKRRGRLAALTADRVAQVGVVEAFGRQGRELSRFLKRSGRLRAALVRRGWIIGFLRAVAEGGAAAAGLTALVVGAWEVGRGATTPGTVVACMLVAGLVAPRLQDCGRALEFWTAYRVARERQHAFLADRPERRPGPRRDVPEGPGALVVQDVLRPPLRHAVSTVIEGGTSVAVVGPSGSGKSSLARVLAGLAVPHEGRVLLDGVPVDRLRRRDRAGAVGLVSPDLPLLRGSLRSNLTYGTRAVTDAEIAALCGRLGLDDLLAGLPRGLDSPLTERAARLSAGERARLCLARTLLARPRLLILDEVDAHLDARAKAAIPTLLADWPATRVVITHDPAFARAMASRVFTLEAGRLEERPEAPSRPPVDLSLVRAE